MRGGGDPRQVCQGAEYVEQPPVSGAGAARCAPGARPSSATSTSWTSTGCAETTWSVCTRGTQRSRPVCAGEGLRGDHYDVTGANTLENWTTKDDWLLP